MMFLDLLSHATWHNKRHQILLLNKKHQFSLTQEVYVEHFDLMMIHFIKEKNSAIHQESYNGPESMSLMDSSE